MNNTDIEKELRDEAMYCECNFLKAVLAAADIVAKSHEENYLSAAAKVMAWNECERERDELRAKVAELEAEKARLRDGILKAWQAMDSYGTAKSDAWKAEWLHILSNSAMSDGGQAL